MTDTQVMAALEPTQADRDAAADAYASVWWNSETPLMRLIREGKRDDDQMVQAFARHRLASSSSAAEPVAWMYEKDDRTCLWRDKAGPGEMCHGNGWIETPLYAAPVPPPAGDAEGLISDLADALEDAKNNGFGEEFFRRAVNDLLARARAYPSMAGQQNVGRLSKPVVALVIAAREAWEDNCISGDALDKALEPFAALVPFDDEPEDDAALATPPSVPAQQGEGWICDGLPDDMIEAGIDAWAHARDEMREREESEEPWNHNDWDDGMIVAAIFKAMVRAATPPAQDQKGEEAK